MYIKSVSIKNFRLLTSVSPLHLDPKTTVVVGRNNSGNARLRQAIQRARDEADQAKRQQANEAAATAEKRRQTERYRYLLDGISPKHCRLGRTALELHQRELAERAGVSLLTIIRFEQGAVSPRASTVRKIKVALESYGLLFLERGIVWPDLAPPDVS